MKKVQLKTMLNKKHILILFLVIIALIMRVHHLTDISLWHDEAFSALLIKYSWSEMIYRIGLDVHPPLYYIVLRIWSTFFGDSLLSLRAFSAFFGVLAVPVAYAFVKTAFKNSKAAFWSALLIALNPFFVYYVTEARMYTFGAFLLLLTAYVLVKGIDSQLESDYNLAARPIHKRYYFFFGLLSVAMLYTHYYLAFSIFALGLYGLVVLFKNYGFKVINYLWLGISVALSFLLFVPWIPTFLKQLNQVEGGYWIPQMDRWSIPSSLWQILTNKVLDTGNQFDVFLVILMMIALIIAFIALIRKQTNTEKILLVFLTLAPFFGSILFYILARIRGSESSVFLVRYLVFTVPFILILVSVVLTSLKKQALGIVLLFSYAVGSVHFYYSYWQSLSPDKKPGIGGASKYLNAEYKSGDIIVSGSSFEFFNLKYYNKTESSPLLYTENITSINSLPHFAGTAILTDKELLSSWKNIEKPGQIVWVISTNAFGSSKTSVPENWFEQETKNYLEVRPYDGAVIYLSKYQVR